jgi:hypothetical protein
MTEGLDAFAMQFFFSLVGTRLPLRVDPWPGRQARCKAPRPQPSPLSTYASSNSHHIGISSCDFSQLPLPNFQSLQLKLRPLCADFSWVPLQERCRKSCSAYLCIIAYTRTQEQSPIQPA